MPATLLAAAVAAPMLAGDPQGVLIYANSCAGGCGYALGPDDPQNDTSSLLAGAVSPTPFAATAQQFQEVVDCLRDLLRPFDAEVTTEDPGGEAHLELVIAGDPVEAGFAKSVGSLAPFLCSQQTNSIAFVFANIFLPSTRSVCETAVREVGHLSGVENEIQCADVMSLLTGCGDKSFTDTVEECGSFAPSACACGGSTQNSYQRMLETLGPAVVFADGFESGDLSAWSAASL